MNVFCEACAKKPGWDFKAEYVVMRSCMRCLLHRPCNHYVDKKPVHESMVVKHSAPAPLPKDLVKDQVNPHAEATLPKAKVTGVPPVPADAPVAVPQQGVVPAEHEAAVKAEAAVAAPLLPSVPSAKAETEADMALNTLQPNRPGIKLETKRK